MKRITLLGTSGVGKTTLSALLEREGWYHYSGDYRIATHYLYLAIANWLETSSPPNSLLGKLLAADAINISPKISTDNLTVVSEYINKLGCNGLDLSTFITRQQAFSRAEINSMLDVPTFIEMSQRHGYDRFINDAGGSVGEIDDASLFHMLKANTLIIYIHADEALQQELLGRSLAYPKPICYHPDFLKVMIERYQTIHPDLSPDEFNSDDFIRFVTPNLLAHRRKRYQTIAKHYGLEIDAKAVWQVRDGQDFQALVSQAIRKKGEV